MVYGFTPFIGVRKTRAVHTTSERRKLLCMSPVNVEHSRASSPFSRARSSASPCRDNAPPPPFTQLMAYTLSTKVWMPSSFMQTIRGQHCKASPDTRSHTHTYARMLHLLPPPAKIQHTTHKCRLNVAVIHSKITGIRWDFSNFLELDVHLYVSLSHSIE